MTTDNRAKLQRMEETQCVHFTGTADKACQAGIEYDSVRKRSFLGLGSKSSLPCIACDNECGASCEKYQAPSISDIHIRRKRSEAIEKATTAITRDAGGLRGIRGTVQCPVCGGKIHYVISAQNGLKRGTCEKPGCLTFKE